MTEWRLIRDKVPDIMVAKGIADSADDPMFRRVEGAELRNYLCRKLYEEVGELLDDPNAEEFADVYEVLSALARAFNIDYLDINVIRMQKRRARGGFRNGRLWAYDPDLRPTDTGYRNDPEVS